MIISVEKAKGLVSFPDSWTDEKIKMKLLAVEQTIRAYTNNNFQDRGYRLEDVCIRAGVFMSEALNPFDVDDTVQISESRYNSGLFTVSEAEDTTFMVNEDTRDEDDVLVTKIVYPADVIDCCVNLMEWEVNFRGKVGVKSETLSRHSITYEDSSALFKGYPKGILSALSNYKKMRY
jgi:hypothetical protein